MFLRGEPHRVSRLYTFVFARQCNDTMMQLFRADGAFSLFLKKCLHSNAISGRWCIRFFFKKMPA
jgi:hypothetical protein